MAFPSMVASEMGDFHKTTGSHIFFGTVGVNDALLLPAGAGFLFWERILGLDVVGVRQHFLCHDDLGIYEGLQREALEKKEEHSPVCRVRDFLTLYEPKTKVAVGLRDSRASSSASGSKETPTVAVRAAKGLGKGRGPADQKESAPPGATEEEGHTEDKKK